MGPPVEIVVAQLVFSGLIAAAVSFLLNRHDERRRTARDYITKLFDAAREDVARAMDFGVDYYTGDYAGPGATGKVASDNVRLREARVLLGERNVRAALALLRQISRAERGVSLDTLQPLEVDFIAALTEHYGESNPAAPDRARSVVLRGAPLRQELGQLRQAQLRPRTMRDGVNRAAVVLIGLVLLAVLSFGAGFYGGSMAR